MTRLYVVRHGRTEHNAVKRIQGTLIDDPLDEMGRGQAAAVAERFAAAAKEGERFRAVCASHLKRAYLTAEAIADRLGLTVEAEPALAEFSWGEYLGRIAEGEVAEFVDEARRRWQDGDLDFAAPGGESPRAAAARLTGAVDALLARHGATNDAFILVAHGRVNKILLASLVHGDVRSMEEFPQSNTGVTLIERVPASDEARTTGNPGADTDPDTSLTARRNGEPNAAASGNGGPGMGAGAWRVVYKNDVEHLTGTPFDVDREGARFA